MEDHNLLLQEEKEFKRTYQFSLWWVEHRAMLRRLGYGLFAFCDVVLLVFVIWTMVDSFVIASTDESRAVAQMVAYGQTDLHAYTRSQAAAPIVPEEVRVFSLGKGRYDFYVPIQNENEEWWAEFHYRFSFDTQVTETLRGFILPNQQKPLAALAIESQIDVQRAELELFDISWHRLDPRVIADYPKWRDEHIHFEITDAIFTSETGFENETFGHTSFRVFNKTAYSYINPVFFVLLKRGSAVVGVSRIVPDTLAAGSHRDISLNWFGVVPTVNSVEVIPDILLFDPDVYRDPIGQPSLDTRTKF